MNLRPIILIFWKGCVNMYPALAYTPRTYRLGDLNGGAAIDKGESNIPDNCGSDMLNMVYSEGGLKKRKGQLLLFNEENLITSLKESYYNYFIYHASDKIKAYNTITKEITTLYGPVNKKRGCFFTYNGFVYYVGGGEYYKISLKDEELICEVVEGYIPTVAVNCNYESIGDDYEPYNYLTESFKLSYITSKNSDIFYFPENLSIRKLKSILVTFNSEEINNYTLDMGNRCITFNSMEEGQNLLEITYYMENGEDRGKIVNCDICESFGGLSAGISEGTRMFLAGNPDYKTTFFYSGLKNPEYFPVNQFDILGDDNYPITGMGKQYNGLVFFKEKSIYISYYEYLDDSVNFTLSRLNSEIGCDCKNTIAMVGNQLVWLNSNFGMMTLFSTYIKEEKNVKCISANINGFYSSKALLNQENIKNAVSFVTRDALYLAVGEYTYMMPLDSGYVLTENSSWYILDNISCRDFIFYNREVYLLGERGVTYFKNILYDFDVNTPIKAYFKTKAIDFNSFGVFKNIYEITFSLRAIQNSYFVLKVWDENGKIKNEWNYKVNKFNFLNFDFRKFTFMTNIFSFAVNRRLKRARVKYLMLEFSNDLSNSQMNISDINISYSVERSVRLNGI